MKSKVLTAFLIAAAFVVGMMVANGNQQAQASVDLSTLYTQLDAMQDKLDNLDLVCEADCNTDCYYMPDFKVTEFVTVTEVMTDTVVVTDYVTEIVYRDTIITETVYIDVPVCNQPQVEQPEAPQVEVPEAPQAEDTPKADTPQVEDEPQVEDTPQVEDKPKCNQGVGNGDEGCDPGNSNHNQDSNDEATSDGKLPGSPGRQHNTNSNSDNNNNSQSDDHSKGKSDKVKDDKGKKNN